MSPCMAATYGSPPNRYGFHWGIPCPARSDWAAKSRKAKPAMYWSLCGLTRNCPDRTGYASASVASTYASAAQPIAKRGAGSRGAAGLLSGRGIRGIGSRRAPMRGGTGPEEESGDDFEQREPDPRCERDERSLRPRREARICQNGHHGPFARAEAGWREESKITDEIRDGVSCQILRVAASRAAEQAGHEQAECRAVDHPRGDVAG